MRSEMTTWRQLRRLSLIMMASLAVLTGCTGPTPATLICVFDSSKSALPFRPAAIQTVKNLCNGLDGNIDRLSLYHMGQSVYSIYSGPAKVHSIGGLLDEYARSQPEESGTAYGLGLERAVTDAELAMQHRNNVAIVVLGDGADEHVAKGGNIEWSKLMERMQKLPVDHSVLAFLFVHPQWGDAFKQKLDARFYERLIIKPPEEASQARVVQEIKRYIHR